MRTKKTLVTVSVLSLFVLAFSCGTDALTEVNNVKDLDDNMIDLRMYHENLGDAIVKQNQDEAIWLHTGMDSVLQILAVKFTEHRKLNRPFGESYRRDLKPSISTLGEALDQKNWEGARTAYTMLTKKCNGCHRDRDIDKTVQNWLERKQHQ